MTGAWADRRSGNAGCVAGNLVLEAIAKKTGRPLMRIKGTVFDDGQVVSIGRVCATDAYLGNQFVHWANLSWTQHSDEEREAIHNKRRLQYLFITAKPNEGTISYWTPPGELVGSVLVVRGKNRRGQTSGVHIRKKGKLFFLADEDITKYHHLVELTPAERRRLSEAYESEIAPVTKSSRVPPSKPPRITTAAPADDGEEPQRRVFQIPMKSGETATLVIPGAATRADVDRIKSYIDLVSDLLSEG